MTTTGITAVWLAKQQRAILVAASALVVILSWVLLAYGHVRSDAFLHAVAMPAAARFDLPTLALAFLLWMVMTVAMMLPVSLPWVFWLVSLEGNRPAAGVRLRPAAFLAGYFAIWAMYCLGAALIQSATTHQAWISLDRLQLARAGGGALLLVAGLFQLTPLKASCLRHCRTPLGFFLANWREGGGGAFSMGWRHGLFCLACCWALMAMGFALGVMNLWWMGVITLLICLENLAPRGPAFSRLIGLGLSGWGGWLLLT